MGRTIGLALLAIALFQPAGFAAERAGADAATPLGIALEEYPYAWPVHFLPLAIEGQDLRMAYMDVPPSVRRMAALSC